MPRRRPNDFLDADEMTGGKKLVSKSLPEEQLEETAKLLINWIKLALMNQNWMHNQVIDVFG